MRLPKRRPAILARCPFCPLPSSQFLKGVRRVSDVASAGGTLAARTLASDYAGAESGHPVHDHAVISRGWRSVVRVPSDVSIASRRLPRALGCRRRLKTGQFRRVEK